MRVVSLNCSNTEIVAALSCENMLVGVDVDSDYPEEVVSRLPRVGRDLTIDIEAVAELEPDLVLASLTVPGHEEVVAGLVDAGLPHYAPETITLDDVFGDILHIAIMLGVAERGEELVDDMRGVLQAREPRTRRPSIWVEWWPKPAIAAGRLSWVHDLIELAGGRNALGDREVKSAPVAPEEVESLQIDDVVISWCGVPSEKYSPAQVLGRKGWESTTAVREARVHAVPEAFLGRPGPRLVEGYRALRAIVDQA